MEISGSTALVTGSSRNSGRAIAVKLAERGADVGITARTNQDGCEETARLAKDAGADTAIALADLSDPDEIESMVSQLRAELGSIDILINNATYRPSKPFLDLDLEEVNNVQNINFRGLFLTTQHVLPDMIEQGGGAVVNLLGALVYLGSPGHVHSYGSKLAIEGLVRQLATEFGPDGIRVNGVSPGLIEVDRDRGEQFEERKEQIVASTPLKRTGSVEEVADACCFLASDQASFITGQVLHVNGGTYPIPDLVSDR